MLYFLQEYKKRVISNMEVEMKDSIYRQLFTFLIYFLLYNFLKTHLFLCEFIL